MDVFLSKNGARLSAYDKCNPELKNDRKLFLLVANDPSPIEVRGDLTKVAGNMCPKEAAGNGSYVEIKVSGNFSVDQKAFLLIGKWNDVKDLKLKEQPFEKVKNTNLCIRPKHQTTLYRTKDNRFTYFSQTTPDCDWQYYGLHKNSKCTVIGKTILDCPAGGPTADSFYGAPQSLYTLTHGTQTEEFILADSTFWEYYGSSIGRIENDTLVDIRQVFTDDCASH